MKRRIFLFALVISSLFLSVLPGATQRNQSPDYVTGYAPVAANILAGKGITDDSGNLFTLYAPGYPVILSVLFKLSEMSHMDRLDLIAIFNVLVFSITAIFLFLIAETIFSRKIALISALLWITYPFNLWLIKQPNSEVPFICLVYLAIWLFFLNTKKISGVLSVVAGAVFGLSAYVRPVGLLFGLMAALLILFFKEAPRAKRLLCSVLLIVGLVLTVSPWEMVVFSSQKKVIPIGSEGPKSVADGLVFAIHPGVVGKQTNVPEDVLLLMKRAERVDLKTSQEIFHFISQEFSQYPAVLLKLIGIKIARSWYGTDWMWHENLIFPIQVIYLSLAIVGLVFAFRSYEDRSFYMISLIVIVLGIWGATVCVRSLLRYMVPVMGFVIIFSAVFVRDMLGRLTVVVFNKSSSTKGLV